MHFDPEVVDKLFALNKHVIMGKLEGDASLPERIVVESVIGSVRSKLARGSASAYTFSDNEQERQQGLVVAEPSSWDSQHFETSIDKFTLLLFDPQLPSKQRALLIQKAISARKARVTFARVNMLDMPTVQALEHVGAILTDVLLTFRFDCGRPMPILGSSTSVEIRPANRNEAEELAKIGETIFKIDRFHSDPNIPSTKSDKLYGKWVLNSLAGLADALLVARRDGQIIGLVTCKVEHIKNDYSFGVIDLVGVRSSHQGHGVASRLVQSSLEWFSGKVHSVYVGTQAANSKAVRLYERFGFSQVSSEASFHLWSNNYSG